MGTKLWGMTLLIFIAPLLLYVNSVHSAECKKIIVSGNAEYPPITWVRNKQPYNMAGVAIELVEMAFRELGMPVEGKNVGNWKRTQESAKYGEIDILADAYINEERKTYLAPERK